MVGKGYIPLFVAKEGIKFTHSWILLLICPCELPILKMYFFEATSVEGVSESHNPATVRVGSVLVSGTVNLIEVTRY